MDVDTQVELSLSPTKTESVDVVGDVAAVDLKSTEVNFNYTGSSTSSCRSPAATTGCSS